jgi:hypothetical protein
VAGYSQEVKVTDAMRLKIHDWRGKGGWLALLQHFLAIGAMDQVNFDIIKSKSLDTGIGRTGCGDLSGKTAQNRARFQASFLGKKPRGNPQEPMEKGIGIRDEIG